MKTRILIVQTPLKKIISLLAQKNQTCIKFYENLFYVSVLFTLHVFHLANSFALIQV